VLRTPTAAIGVSRDDALDCATPCRQEYSLCSANPRLPFAPLTEASVDRHLAEAAEFQSISEPEMIVN
jgi:hypothetical protein